MRGNDAGIEDQFAAPRRMTVAIDFDGVIHSYTSPWTKPEEINDGPTEGAIEYLEEITKTYEVAIFSTRAHNFGGTEAITAWLADHGLSWAAHDHITITAMKPMALVYIDDRAWRFTGDNWPSVEEIESAMPWNKVKPHE
jgi:hypothetical protein